MIKEELDQQLREKRAKKDAERKEARMYEDI